MNNILVVYNICGISNRQNHEYYLSSLKSILDQEFDGFKVAVSGCQTSEHDKNLLQDTFQSQIYYSWVEDIVPISVTFNHTVRKCVKEFGPFYSYLYVDSGITFGSDRCILQHYWDIFTIGDVGMIASQVGSDNGYDLWGISLVSNENYVIPVGKCCNLHSQLFHHKIYEYYNQKILPDIFATYTMESIFSFVNAVLNLKYVIAHNISLQHVHSMDIGSAGFPGKTSPTSFDALSTPSMDQLHFRTKRRLSDICIAGKPYGFGYEEWAPVCPHDPTKFDNNGFALDDRLGPFIRDNLFLTEEEFNYNDIK